METEVVSALIAMYLHRFGRLAATIVACGAFCLPDVSAQTPPATAARELKIASGKIVDASRSGPALPATLSNVVGVLRESYPEASITVVGVDDVLIDNITLRIAPRTTRREGALRIALAALAEASGRSFRVQDFGDQDFVLGAERSPPGRRFAEVFNLGTLLSNHRGRQVERELRDAETHLAAIRKVMGNDHPRVAEINTHIEILKATKAQAGTPPETSKVIDQIKEAVAVTLAMLRSPEKVPDFQFHPGANLLIVVGGDDTIDITRKVVAALEKGAN
jgi:hypothetical protein